MDDEQFVTGSDCDVLKRIVVQATKLNSGSWFWQRLLDHRIGKFLRGAIKY
jgi:hypothetical protein